MSYPEQLDLLVIGSGEGGKFLAWHMAKSNHRTAVVERRLVGGSCPNTNCLPSKNEIWSAKVADLVHHADRFGMVTGPVSTDMAKVLARKKAMVDGLIALHLDHYKSSGAELVMGTARFVAPKTVEVDLNDGGTRVLSASRIALNLGTHAAVPNIPGLTAAAPLTNVELLELDRLPDHLIVLGGGYVGLEFAQAYRRFGSRVTILEGGEQLVAREDADIASAMLQILRDEGIEVYLATKLLAVQGHSGNHVTLRLGTPTGEQTIEASDILVATGRSPNTQGISLDIAGVELDERGFIRVNERLETTAPDIWAIGDCAGSPQFTHVSFDDFRIVRDNLGGGQRSTRNRLVPYCMFTDPPLARIGLSEDEAKRQGIAVRTVKLPITSVLRARTTSETTGFMKALIEAHGGRVLGFAMLGAEAGEVVAVVQTAMLAGLPYSGLRDAIFTHPTMAEGLVALFSNVESPP
jgi:pyruvate/2-oxoglutarate dehydrogenase complex dihydrolipoamide dehydrogenase (E3) component